MLNLTNETNYIYLKVFETSSRWSYILTVDQNILSFASKLSVWLNVWPSVTSLSCSVSAKSSCSSCWPLRAVTVTRTMAPTGSGSSVEILKPQLGPRWKKSSGRAACCSNRSLRKQLTAQCHTTKLGMRDTIVKWFIAKNLCETVSNGWNRWSPHLPPEFDDRQIPIMHYLWCFLSCLKPMFCEPSVSRLRSSSGQRFLNDGAKHVLMQKLDVWKLWRYSKIMSLR